VYHGKPSVLGWFREATPIRDFVESLADRLLASSDLPYQSDSLWLMGACYAISTNASAAGKATSAYFSKSPDFKISAQFDGVDVFTSVLDNPIAKPAQSLLLIGDQEDFLLSAARSRISDELFFPAFASPTLLKTLGPSLSIATGGLEELQPFDTLVLWNLSSNASALSEQAICDFLSRGGTVLADLRGGSIFGVDSKIERPDGKLAIASGNGSSGIRYLSQLGSPDAAVSILAKGQHPFFSLSGLDEADITFGGMPIAGSKSVCGGSILFIGLNLPGSKRIVTPGPGAERPFLGLDGYQYSSMRPAEAGRSGSWERGIVREILHQQYIRNSLNFSLRQLVESPGSIELKYSSGRESWLLFSEAYFPGWSADLDDRPIPVLKAMPGFIVVRTLPGEHTVHLSYCRTPAHLAGLIISSAAFAACMYAVFAHSTLRGRGCREGRNKRAKKVPQR
jgi:hypothetical protein